MSILSLIQEKINESIPCSEQIWADGDDPRRSTYCMLKKGHAGKHSPFREPPPEKEIENLPEPPIQKTTADIILEKYGPRK